jgi:hypothetical protein
MIKKYVVGIAITLMAIMLYGLIEGSITGNLVKEEKIVIYFPESADFPNPNEGTVVFEFSFPSASFKVGDKDADVLMFLDSDTVSGLKLGYDVNQKKLMGGLPSITSSEVNIIDGNKHKIAYSFHKTDKKQVIYVDDNMVAEGEYTGVKEGDVLTGYSVYQKWTYVESPLAMKVSFSESCEEKTESSCGCRK